MADKSRSLNWPGIKLGLREVYKTHAQLFYSAVLVGGAACWFYRNELENAHDPDFFVRNFMIPNQNEQARKTTDFELITWLVIKSP